VFNNCIIVFPEAAQKRHTCLKTSQQKQLSIQDVTGIITGVINTTKPMTLEVSLCLRIKQRYRRG